MISSSFLINQLFRRTFQRAVDNKSQYVRNPDKDFTRKRRLPFEVTFFLTLTMESGSLNTEVLKATIGFDETPVSTPAFTQQRDKLLPELFQDFFFDFTNTVERFIHHDHWFGYRVLAVDGSQLNLPYNEKEDEFKNRKGTACVAHLHGLLDVLNNVVIDAIITPAKSKGEAKVAAQMVDRLRENYDSREKFLLIADRGYENYNLIAHCVSQDVDFLIRVKDVDSKGISRRFDLPDSETFDVETRKKISHNQAGKPDGRRGETDYIYPPAKSYDYPEDIEVLFRFIRFVPEEGKEPILLVTSVPQSKIPTDFMTQLYHQRWFIETQFNRLKNRLGIESPRSKKADAIKMEIFSKLFLFNYVFFMILAMELRVRTEKYLYVPNFAVAVRLIRDFFKGKISLRNVEASLRRRLQPVRPGRQFPHGLAKQNYNYIYICI